MIVYVSIGNSDDKLTQRQWAEFCADVDNAVDSMAHAVHGAWFSLSDSMWQNACWCFEPDKDRIGILKRYLAQTAKRYSQDSVAWAEVKATEFLGGGQ